MIVILARGRLGKLMDTVFILGLTEIGMKGSGICVGSMAKAQMCSATGTLTPENIMMVSLTAEESTIGRQASST